MATAVLHSDAPERTFFLGEALGRLLQDGDFVALLGDLGAGKTAFSRGVAQGAGAPVEDVSSPTYAILQSYRGRVLLHHADLYRLSTPAELESVGFHDARDEGGALLVEWADRIPSAIPADCVVVRFEVRSESARALHVEGRGPRGAALADAWVAAVSP